MARIVLNQVARGEVKDAKSYKPERGDHYNKLVAEANKMIELDRIRYASACKKATVYLAR